MSSADDLSRPEMDAVVEETFAAQNLELRTDEEWKLLRAEKNEYLKKLAAAKLSPDALIGTTMHATIEQYEKVAQAADKATVKLVALEEAHSALRNSGRVGQSSGSVGRAALANTAWARVDSPAAISGYVVLTMDAAGNHLAHLGPDLLITQDAPPGLVVSIQYTPVDIGGTELHKCELCGSLAIDTEQHSSWHMTMVLKDFRTTMAPHMLREGPTIEEFPI